MEPLIQSSRAEMAEAFALWLTRYNENPESCEASYPAAPTYGDACTSYLVELLGEIQTQK